MAKNDLLRNWKCMLACILVSMSPFQYGIDFGLIGGLQAMIGFLKIFGYPDPAVAIGYNISAGRQQMISSLMTLGAFIGSCSAGIISLRLGRKASLWMACALCFVADIIMMTTTSIGGLYAGRLLIGIANGFFMTFSQLYLQECSPARYRGMAISAFQFWTSLGTLVGTIVDNFTAKIMGRGSYLIPLGLIYIVPAIMTVGMLFIPESPRWLAQRGRHAEARKSLEWLRPDADQIDQELAGIIDAIEVEKMEGHGVGVLDLFKNPVDRRRTLLAVAAVTLQAASGAMYMIAYGTYFFEMAGIGNAFQNSCILTAVGVVVIIINTAVISHIGRRREFLTIGLVLCAICQLIVAIIYTKSPGTQSTGRAIVGVSVIYIVGYNGMISAYAWLAGGEIPSQRLRSYTFGLAAAIGFLGAWVTTFTAPYFINPSSLNWGPKYGYIWFVSALIGAAFVVIFLPETKNRSLEEIDEMFEARVSAWKFSGYQCRGLVNLVHEKGDVEDVPAGNVIGTEAGKGTVVEVENARN